jgi:hypothetical protein
MAKKSYELVEATSRLIATQPFYAVLLLDLLELKESEGTRTAHTDGKELVVNPVFFKETLKDAD